MSVARGTTPAYVLTFDDGTLDLTTANNVYVTFKKGTKILTKTGEDITVAAKQIEVYLSQKETLSFSMGDVKVQVNWTTAGGMRACSEVVSIALSEQLLEKVIE
mgnify:CR=1 FL=1